MARVSFKQCCSCMPILGPIGRTSRNDHVEALRELGVSWLISAMPIWGGIVILLATSGVNTSRWACFFSMIQNGELFLYAASTLAPVMYIVTRDRYTSPFPSKYAFICTVYFMAVVSAIIFTIQRLKGGTLPEQAVILSVVLYGLSIVVFYFALAYNNSYLPNPATEIRNNEEDYMTRYRAHRQTDPEA